MCKSNSVYIKYARLEKDSWDDDRYREYINFLPRPFHAGINRYLQWQDRQRSIIGKLLLKEALSDFGLSADVLMDMKFSKFGKPYFEGSFNFNISHSGEFIICAAANDINIGVDIEKIVPVNPDEFHHVMDTDQRKKIMKAENSDNEFFKFWTAKEAVAKAAGFGLSVPFSKITTDFRTAQFDGSEWHLREINGINNYPAFIASDFFIDEILISCANEFILP